MYTNIRIKLDKERDKGVINTLEKLKRSGELDTFIAGIIRVALNSSNNVGKGINMDSEVADKHEMEVELNTIGSNTGILEGEGVEEHINFENADFDALDNFLNGE